MVVYTKTWRTQYRRRPFKEIRQNRSHPYNYETATEKMFIHKIRLRIPDHSRKTAIQSSRLS